LIGAVTGGTISIDATYAYYTFNDSGTIKWGS
jgi:hypothetical protein